LKKIKVLIVDDSAFMRKLISDFLSESPYIDVIGTARNGLDALDKIKQLMPDVITMDIEMPVMNGMEALKQIMKQHPIPVIMLSSTTQESADNTLLALQYGALDFIAKPSGSISLDLYKVKEELCEKVISASKVQLKRLNYFPDQGNNNINRLNDYSKIELSRISHINLAKRNQQGKKKIICIGTSTGGPRALQQVLRDMPKSVQAPILIVQHMPAGFTKSLASRLDMLCEIKVKEAEHNELLQDGTAYIAPGGYHLRVSQLDSGVRVELDQDLPRNGHRPSVDVLYESISRLEGYEKVAVIMTGMGTDGAKGLSLLKESGTVKAIAESRETAIVYGMPRAAVETGLIDEVQNIENITTSILKYV
jgi:two-component system, chemotaxis family, protein-glutamate methylesterase/glutaminase